MNQFLRAVSFTLAIEFGSIYMQHKAQDAKDLLLLGLFSGAVWAFILLTDNKTFAGKK